MPRVNIPEDRPLAEGEFLAEVENIDNGYTKGDDEMWTLRLRLLEGPDEDQTIKDRIVFSAKAANRLRIVAKAFGLPTVGDVDFEPGDLLHKRVKILIEHEEYDGKMLSRVAFRGYKQAPPTPVKAAPAKREPGEDPPDPVRERFQGDSARTEREPLPKFDEPPFGDEPPPF